jgi:hypothetical protein
LYFPSTFGVQKEEELTDASDHIKGVKLFTQHLQLWEGRHQFKNVVFKILLLEIAIATAVVERDLNARLEQVYLADYIAEEWTNFNATEFVTLKL